MIICSGGKLDRMIALPSPTVVFLSFLDSICFCFTMNVFCSVLGFHWWGFLVFPFFSLCGGNWPSPWISPASDHTYPRLLISHHDAASSHLQTQCHFCSPSPFHLLGSFDILAYHIHLLFTRKPFLSLGSPGEPLTPTEHETLSTPCLLSPSKLLCFSGQGLGRAPCLFSRQLSQCN